MTLHSCSLRLFALLCVLALSATPFSATARAEDAGQADLDQAIEGKLAAESLEDLGKVIDLAREALKKGLDEENTKFAKQLLAAAYVQRGGALSEAIFHSSPNEAGWLEQMNRVRLTALADLEEAVELEPNNVEALYIIGRLQILPEGDRDRAQEALDLALKNAGEDNLIKAKIHMARVPLLDDRDARIAEFTEAIKASPDEAEYVRARGLAYADAGKLPEAIADLQKAIELDPAAGSSYEALSLVFASSRDYDRAVEILDKLVTLDPKAPLVYAQRARIQMLRNKPDEAVADLTKTLELLPDNPGVLLLRAEAQQKKGDNAAAMTDVEAVLRLRDDFIPAIQLRGLLFAEAGKLDEAAADLQKVVDALAQDPLPRLQLAMLQLSRKKARVAIDEFSKVLDLDPQSWIARQGRADAYLAIGKQAEALADYNEGVKLQPKNSAMLNNLAWLLATSPDDKLRDGSRAIELAKEACEVTDYKAAHILSTLAAGYAETGDFDNARQWSSKALELTDDRYRDALKKEFESYQANKPWRELLNESETPAAEPTEKPVETDSNTETKTAEKPASSSERQ